LKVAALDLGSNTFLCLIVEVENSQITKIYHDSVEAVRLGQELTKNKKFHPEALIRADKCLQDFSKIIEEHQPQHILAMATSAARDAKNKEELFAIANKYNIPLEIIAGDKEASITYKGAVSAQAKKPTQRLVIDIGGGSTEFIFGKGLSLLNGISLDIGCVRLTERFVSAQPTPTEEIEKINSFIQQELQQVLKLKPDAFEVQEILAVAGTPTALAAAEVGQFVVEKIDGYKLTETSLSSWLDKLHKSTVEEKIEMGIPAGRADVIIIGVITLLQTLKLFNLSDIIVSTRGVRYGVALELASRYSS
jgi:exopolyphosphatase/guanosine-5'-triphosphate,3'-diphosphate pyrophosphatase